MSEYFPDQGDFIILTFDPQAGHEQMGRRPALVLSKKAFNEKVGFAFVCPITSTIRPYPFHLELPPECDLHGVVMIDQARSLDFRARRAKPAGQAPKVWFNEVLKRFKPIIF